MNLTSPMASAWQTKGTRATLDPAYLVRRRAPQRPGRPGPITEHFRHFYAIGFPRECRYMNDINDLGWLTLANPGDRGAGDGAPLTPYTVRKRMRPRPPKPFSPVPARVPSTPHSPTVTDW